MMNELGKLYREGDRFVFTCPEVKVTVSGDHMEWVLEAASEVIAQLAKTEADSKIDELEALVEFGEADEVDLDIAKYDLNAQFEKVAQCVVQIDKSDFHWVSSVNRDPSIKTVTRIHDMSLTKNDTFLVDEQQ